jgi:hypothetical protein
MNVGRPCTRLATKRIQNAGEWKKEMSIGGGGSLDLGSRDFMYGKAGIIKTAKATACS